MSEYMSIREAAAEMGVNYNTALRWIREGRFPVRTVALPEYTRLGEPRRHHRVKRALIEEWKGAVMRMSWGSSVADLAELRERVQAARRYA